MFQNELHFKDHRHRQHPIAGASSHSPANGTSVVSTTVFKQLMTIHQLTIADSILEFIHELLGAF